MSCMLVMQGYFPTLASCKCWKTYTYKDRGGYVQKEVIQYPLYANSGTLSWSQIIHHPRYHITHELRMFMNIFLVCLITTALSSPMGQSEVLSNALTIRQAKERDCSAVNAPKYVICVPQIDVRTIQANTPNVYVRLQKEISPRQRWPL